MPDAAAKPMNLDDLAPGFRDALSKPFASQITVNIGDKPYYVQQNYDYSGGNDGTASGTANGFTLYDASGSKAGGEPIYNFGQDGSFINSSTGARDSGNTGFLINAALGIAGLMTGGAALTAMEGGGAAAAAAGGAEMSGMDMAADGAAGFAPEGVGAGTTTQGALGTGTYDAGLGDVTDANIQGSPLTAGPGAASAPLPMDPDGWAAATGGPAAGSLGAPAEALYGSGEAASGIDWSAIKNGYQLGSLLGGLLNKPQSPDMSGGGAQQPVGSSTLQSGTTAGGSAGGSAVGGVAGSQPGVANTLLTTYDDDPANGGRSGTLLGG